MKNLLMRGERVGAGAEVARGRDGQGGGGWLNMSRIVSGFLGGRGSG